jgi:hypothetical protein
MAATNGIFRLLHPLISLRQLPNIFPKDLPKWLDISALEIQCFFEFREGTYPL